jgi:hypothetical protein
MTEESPAAGGATAAGAPLKSGFGLGRAFGGAAEPEDDIDSLVDGTEERLTRSEMSESALAWLYGKRLYGVGRGWGFLNRVSNDRQVFFSLAVGNSMLGASYSLWLSDRSRS